MKKVNRIFSSIMLISASNYVFAENIPEEFAGFFKTTQKDIEIVISGELSAENVKAIVNFDTFTLVNSAENLAKLSDYLVNSRLKRKATSEIVEQLLKGVESASSCEGDVSNCVPVSVADEAEYVFDYDNNRLRIFVPSSMLDSRAENVEYYKGDRIDNALINESTLYIQSSDSDSSLNWGNNTTLGLPYGYLNANSQYRTSQNKFDVYDLFYNIDYENKRLKLGYLGNSSSSSLNATDSLNSDMYLKGKYITFGSSSNLLKRKNEGVQRLNFFAPQTGQLEVFRGDRMIITKGIKEGEHSLSYNELPSGSYDIKLVLRRGDKIIFEEQRFIVNTSNYSLAVGDYDYKFDFRTIESSTEGHEEQVSLGSAAITYRMSEELLLSSGIGGNQDDQFAQFGLSKVFSDSLNLNFVSNNFSSGSSYQQVAASFYDLNVAVKKTNFNDSKITKGMQTNLATMLYGEDERFEYSLNWGSGLLGGSLNLGFSRYTYTERKESSDAFNFSWTRPLFGGDLAFSGTYNKYAHTDSLNALVTWSYGLGDDYRTSTSAGFNADGLASVRTDVSRSLNGNTWYANGSLAAISSNDEMSGELSMMGNAQTNAFNYNGFAYGSTLGKYSLSGSISGTQFITANHRGVTSGRSNAFILIEPQWQEEVKDGELGYTVLKDDKIWRTGKLKEGHSTLLGVNDYAEIDIRIDAEYQDLEVENEVDTKMTMPGSVYVVGGKVTQLQSQVMVMSDMFGQPIQSANCIGAGCRSIETVSEDGVFRVSFLKTEPFKIVSDNRLCVYDTKAMGKPYLQSYCLEGLDELPSDMIVTTGSDENTSPTDIPDKFVYIGKFNSVPELETILSRLKEVNLISHNLQIGDELYVYVEREEEFTLAQRHILDSLEAYAINNKASDEGEDVYE